MEIETNALRGYHVLAAIPIRERDWYVPSMITVWKSVHEVASNLDFAPAPIVRGRCVDLDKEFEKVATELESIARQLRGGRA
jgi:hypothetical protein